MNSNEIARRRQEHFDLVAKRKVFIEKAVAAFHNGNEAIARDAFKEMSALTPKMCEHGGHWSSNCAGCDELHKEVFPERI